MHVIDAQSIEYGVGIERMFRGLMGRGKTQSETAIDLTKREGKYKGLDGSRPLLPPMPWPNFAQMTDEDLKAVFAYLKSTKPVRNIVPTPIMLAELK